MPSVERDVEFTGLDLPPFEPEPESVASFNEDDKYTGTERELLPSICLVLVTKFHACFLLNLNFCKIKYLFLASRFRSPAISLIDSFYSCTEPANIPNLLPTSDDLLPQILADPRRSVIASMGLPKIIEDFQSLLDKRVDWSGKKNYYQCKVEKLTPPEEEERQTLQRAREKYVQACQVFKTASRAHKATKNNLDRALKSVRVYEVRDHLSELLVDVMRRLKERKFTPWADPNGKYNYDEMKFTETPIEEIRKILKLESTEAVKKLNRNELLSVLRIMEIMNYVEHSFFIGLWQLRPGNWEYEDWCDRYGTLPTEIKTGRGSGETGTVEGLKLRVCHYLGHPHRVVVVTHEEAVEALAREEKEMERRLANIKKRKAEHLKRCP